MVYKAAVAQEKHEVNIWWYVCQARLPIPFKHIVECNVWDVMFRDAA